LSEKNKSSIENFLNRLSKRYWRFLSGAAFFIVFLELFEVLHKNETLTDPFHLTELILYIFFLALVGVLFTFLVRLNTSQKHTMEILNHKHNTSLGLSNLEDWEKLPSELARLPSTIAAVQASRLLVQNEISGKMEQIAHWHAEDDSIADFYHDCQQCLTKRENDGFSFGLCPHEPAETGTSIRPLEYCIPIKHANSLMAVIQVQLNTGATLSSEQIEIFENINPEIALAFRAGQEQKKLVDFRLAEMALAERHSLSTYLHDNLSQNLAYLCLKLEQFTSGEELYSEEEGRIELLHMKGAAYQSYDIVRGKIENIHPQTTPRLINLFKERARTLSERHNIKVSLKKKGEPLPLKPEIQQAVFYVFQEALNNIEKHSHAENANILINWGKDNLTVSISDDGIGFDPQDSNGNKHFGLAIIQERISKVNGQVGIRSSANSGTEITIFVPIPLPERNK
jgi:signal transduction histidine kinase